MLKYADNSFVSDPGNPIHTLYHPKVSANGRVDLVEAGFENTDDYIQSFAESTDIRVILARVANGEYELLNQRNALFGDFTGMPKTYAEALQLHIDSNRLFDGLPVDIKEKFHNDANEFFASSGSSDWVDKLGDVLPEEVRKAFSVPVVEPIPVVDNKEVSSNES